MTPLMDHLHSLGVVPVPAVVPPATQAELLLEAFRMYLAEERGLAPGTVSSDIYIARTFLASRPHEDLGLERLTPREIAAFVKEQCEQRSAAYVTAGLRAFLRFCHLSGRTPRPLASAARKSPPGG